ncbi:MAG: flagellar hook-basal body complex protein FliE [Aquificota bacterium]|nr:MAG: flagellar hook-basal body complex protein FliE [Aquificota bacterium]
MEIRGLGVKPTEREGISRFKSGSFVEELKKFVEWVNTEQKKAENLKERVLKGEDIALHEMVIQMEKAKTALNLLIQVRNKLVEAIQEINRMQV